MWNNELHGERPGRHSNSELAEIEAEIGLAEPEAEAARSRALEGGDERASAETTAENARAAVACLGQELEAARQLLAATRSRRLQVEAAIGDLETRLAEHRRRLGEMGARAERAADELAQLPVAGPDQEVENLASVCSRLERDAADAAAERARLGGELAAIEDALRAAEERRSACAAAIALAEAERGRAESTLAGAAARVSRAPRRRGRRSDARRRAGGTGGRAGSGRARSEAAPDGGAARAHRAGQPARRDEVPRSRRR